MDTIKNYFQMLGHGKNVDPFNVLRRLCGEPGVEVREVFVDKFGPRFRMFLYTSGKQALCVLLDDACPAVDELVDEERFNDELPLYFSATSHRVSPVFSLREAAGRVTEGYEQVFHVLVSSANFINRDDYEDCDDWPRDTLYVEDNYRFRRPGSADKFLGGLKTNGEGIVVEKTFSEMLDEFLANNEVIHDDEEDDEEEIDNGEIADGTIGEEPMPAPRDDVFEPRISSWRDYVSEDDTDFFERNDAFVKQKNVAPCTIYEPVGNATTLLKNMVGMSQMKERINDLVCLARYNELLQRKCGRRHNVTLHSVFLGNPGTGKTTLASILGSLLKDAGVISRGHVVVCNRATFCSGNLWGDEEKAVLQMMKIAKGGVMFIDEAYNLISDNSKDPGFQVLPNLLTMLADERMRDICVVLAGYPKEMDKLLDTNPGIKSRFPNRFEFSDYSVSDLMTIAVNRIRMYDYTFTPGAKRAFLQHIEKLYNARDKHTWGNARAVANLLEEIYIRHAKRVMKGKHAMEADAPTEAMLKLRAADIPPVPENLLNTPRRMGFCR